MNTSWRHRRPGHRHRYRFGTGVASTATTTAVVPAATATTTATCSALCVAAGAAAEEAYRRPARSPRALEDTKRFPSRSTRRPRRGLRRHPWCHRCPGSPWRCRRHGRSAMPRRSARWLRENHRWLLRRRSRCRWHHRTHRRHRRPSSTSPCGTRVACFRRHHSLGCGWCGHCRRHRRRAKRHRPTTVHPGCPRACRRSGRRGRGCIR